MSEKTIEFLKGIAGIIIIALLYEAYPPLGLALAAVALVSMVLT